MSAQGDPSDDGAQVAADSLTDNLRETFASALHLAQASLGLLRAELRLARSSALALVWLGFGLVFFGVGAWMALTVAIAMGVGQLGGHPLLGVGTVALIILAGAAWVLRAMRRCWRDLGLPRTRALIANPPVHATAIDTSTDAGGAP